MAEAGSVKALLQLDASGFDNGIVKSVQKITDFAKTMNKVGTDASKFTDGLKTVVNSLNDLRSSLRQLDNISSFENFNRLSTAMKKLVDTAIRFNKESSVTVSTFTQLGNGIRSFMNAIGGVDIQLTNVVNSERMLVTESGQLGTSLNLDANAARQASAEFSRLRDNLLQTANALTMAELKNNVTFGRGLNNGAEELMRKFNGVSTSARNMGSSITSAGNSASTANQRFNGLNQTMGALKSMVSMVGSMFLYNFAHNMMISVQNTVKAKSEMMSFLHTMGMTGGQIDSFNASLDRTVERFQRVNKYNIGETVANIGLEFNLSSKEMEKAMSVTSMITSEYLRAGRNADEAALAVKDIMQGQFQRLSRETGVKQENLKEAGWSGDTSDVLGLMDALEKVAKARHWDTFAEKASSLNDIVLITQNRLSEWAADMSEGVTPIVTGAFNLIVAGVDGVTKIFGELGSALNLPDWTGTALMIGGVVTALVGLTTSTITARTGLGLLDIAHKGLGQSILATIFNIQAEEMANAKATTIIKARVLGLNAETMAQSGLKGALAESIIMEKAEAMAKQNSAKLTALKAANIDLQTFADERGLTVKQAKVLLERQEALETMKSYQVILTKILGLDAEIVSQQGLLVALGASRSARISDTIATEGEAVAEETLNAARTIGIGLMAAYLAALVAIAAVAAVFLLPAIQQVMEMNEHMKTFNSLVNDGDNMIKDARDTVDSYQDRVNQLNSELQSGTLTAEEYRRKQLELDEANKLLKQSTKDLADVTEAVEQARSSKGKSEESRRNTATKAHQDYQDILEKTGISQQEAEKRASQYYGTLEDGIKVMTELANHEEWNRGRIYDKGMDITSRFFGKEDPEKTAKRVQDYYGIMEGQNKQYAKMLESESLSEYLEGFFGFHWYQGMENLADMTNEWDEKVGPSIENMVNSISGLGSIDIGKWFQDNLVNPISGFGDILNDSSWDLINDIFGNLELPSLDDIFGNLFGGGDSGTGGALKKIDMSWLHEYLGQFITSISDWWNGIDWSFITMQGGSIFNKLLGLDEGVDIGAMLGEKLGLAQQYINDFVTNLTSGFVNLPSTIWTYLNQIITNLVSFASQLLANGLSAGSNFLNGVVTHISQLPSRVYSFITQTASYLLNGASQWVSIARNKATETVNAVISQVSQLPQRVYDEFVKIGQRIRDAVSGAVQAALQFGTDVKNAVLNALGIHSPGFVQEALAKEFADIGGRIAESRSDAESQATSFGQGIVDGMNAQLPLLQQQAQAITDAMSVSADSQAIDFSGQFVGDYQQDANTITGLNQVMTTDTATTFGMMGTTVNTTIDGISANLQTSYANMNTSQTTALTTMQTNNTNAYNRLQTTTTTSLNNMRNTTQNVTLQMVGAWNHMKDNIIASANQLKTQSTAHFNTLSDHIGTFYRKLQNPSMWGAGDKLPTRYYNSARGNRGRSAVRRAFGVSSPKGNYAGGLSPNNLPQTASLRKIRQMIGNNPIFDGLDMSQEVDVQQFLAMLGGSFGWNDWHPSHFDRIKSTSGEWNMRGPQIMHRIDTGESFQVKEFYNSQPNISFSSFQSMAEALFSAIPYDFYWNSDKYGSWVAALQAGACNCWDGAHAILALANTCGFSGHIEHGTWNGLGHVYAVINGKKMDTTGWQNRRDWNGVSAGSPSNMKIGGENKTVNVNIDMTGATFYGEDDFKQRMEDIAQEVMRKEVNASITVGI